MINALKSFIKRKLIRLDPVGSFHLRLAECTTGNDNHPIFTTSRIFRNAKTEWSVYSGGSYKANESMASISIIGHLDDPVMLVEFSHSFLHKFTASRFEYSLYNNFHEDWLARSNAFFFYTNRSASKRLLVSKMCGIVLAPQWISDYDFDGFDHVGTRIY